MGYVAGKPVVGFTLILDGDSDTVEAILKTAMTEMERQFDRAERERIKTFGPADLLGLYRLPVYPVHGEIHLRTTT